jgi:hypothetical protein
MVLDQSGSADTAAARKYSISRAIATVDSTVDAAARLLMGMSPTPASAPCAAPPTALPDATARLLMGMSPVPASAQPAAPPTALPDAAAFLLMGMSPVLASAPPADLKLNYMRVRQKYEHTHTCSGYYVWLLTIRPMRNLRLHTA